MKRCKGRKQMNGQVTLIQNLEIQPSQQGSGKVWASGDGGGATQRQGSGRGRQDLRQGSRQGADGWQMADRGTKETEGEKSQPKKGLSVGPYMTLEQCSQGRSSVYVERQTAIGAAIYFLMAIAFAFSCLLVSSVCLSVTQSICLSLSLLLLYFILTFRFLHIRRIHCTNL